MLSTLHSLLRPTICIALLTASVSASAAPVLRWLNTVHDFGAFNEDMGMVNCRFVAVNDGDEPLVVLDARANCGCTKPTYTKEPIAPGDTLRVEVAFNPTGRPGRFTKQVKVSTNAVGGPSTLSIRGTVIGAPATLNARYPESAGDIRLSNVITTFGETRKGHIIASAVNIYNPTTDSISPAVDSLPPYIHALFRPEVIAPGEQGSLSLTAYTDQAPGWGIVEDSFILIPDPRHPADARRISTVMVLNEDFSKLSQKQLDQAPVAKISTDAIDFRRIDRNAAPSEQTFTIANQGQSDLLIRRLSTASPAIELKSSTSKIKPGKSATVTVRLRPDRIPAGEPLNARITIITNAPAAPNQAVRVVGETL